MRDFEGDFGRFIRLFLPDTAVINGASPEELSSVERRLGFPIPAAVRAYYLVAGECPQLNKSFNQILSPREWRVENGSVFFAEENQKVVCWCFRLCDMTYDDPEVFQVPNGEQTQYPEESHFGEFMRKLLVWQALNGALCCSAQGSGASEVAYAGFRELLLLDNMVVYRQPELLLSVHPDPEGGQAEIRLCSDNTARFRQVLDSLDGVNWYFNSLDEMEDGIDA